MKSQVPTVEVLGVPIARLDRREALARVEELCDRPGPALVFYANAHTLNLAAEDTDYRRVLAKADLVLNDGAGVAIAGRLRRAPFPDNLNGSDFNPEILRLCARRGLGVFLLGARPGVADQAARRLAASIPGLKVVGTRHGYFARNDWDAVASEVAAAGPDVVMAALGNPLQELWLAANLPLTGARLGVGVGAFLDFSAGEVPRAPGWMNRAGIEWIWRLAHEPGRLWRRYVIGNPKFLYRVARESLGLRALAH